MTGRSEGTDGAPQGGPEERPFAPRERDGGDRAATAPDPTGSDKAEPEKAKTEIEAGDVADELADFA